MFEFDKGSKWLLRHHGDAILWLGGIGQIAAWRSVQAEVVEPRQLPDGLLEVQLAGETEHDLFVVEVTTYPDQRVHEQLLRDLILVYADRRVLPEVLILVLHPKGNLQVAFRSPQRTICTAGAAGRSYGLAGGSWSCGRCLPSSCWQRKTRA